MIYAQNWNLKWLMWSVLHIKEREHKHIQNIWESWNWNIYSIIIYLTMNEYELEGNKQVKDKNNLSTIATKWRSYNHFTMCAIACMKCVK